MNCAVAKFVSFANHTEFDIVTSLNCPALTIITHNTLTASSKYSNDWSLIHLNKLKISRLQI